jgi:hypothetical protein
VRAIVGEPPVKPVIDHWCVGLFAHAPPHHAPAPRLLLQTRPPGAPFVGLNIGPLKLIGQEPVADRRVDPMGVDV